MGQHQISHQKIKLKQMIRTMINPNLCGNSNISPRNKLSDFKNKRGLKAFRFVKLVLRSNKTTANLKSLVVISHKKRIINRVFPMRMLELRK
jgi:hypothetical protein